MKVKKEVDCIGQFCPLPLVKTRYAIESVKKGDIVKVLADDEGAKEDFPHWCDSTGNTLVKAGTEKGVLVFYIKKGK